MDTLFRGISTHRTHAHTVARSLSAPFFLTVSHSHYMPCLIWVLAWGNLAMLLSHAMRPGIQGGLGRTDWNRPPCMLSIYAPPPPHYFFPHQLSSQSAVHFSAALSVQTSSLCLRLQEMVLVSHPSSRLIHAAPGSHLPREITSHFNRTHVSNSLHNPTLTRARALTHTNTLKTSQSDSYLHTVTSIFGVKRHLTSLSVTHIQRRAEGENERREMGRGVFSLQLISHHFPTPSISSPLSPLSCTICSYLSAFLNGFPASLLKSHHPLPSLLYFQVSGWTSSVGEEKFTLQKSRVYQPGDWGLWSCSLFIRKGNLFFSAFVAPVTNKKSKVFMFCLLTHFTSMLMKAEQGSHWCFLQHLWSSWCDKIHKNVPFSLHLMKIHNFLV